MDPWLVSKLRCGTTMAATADSLPVIPAFAGMTDEGQVYQGFGS